MRTELSWTVTSFYVIYIINIIIFSSEIYIYTLHSNLMILVELL